MTALAALVGFGPDRIARHALQALSDALTARGGGEALAQHGGARLVIRSAEPKIHQTGGLAMIVDGIVEPSRLAARYAVEGLGGLLAGTNAYAVILADPRGLVLARHLDGPALYYARATDGVLVASEPAALLAAGISMAVNEEVVSRFLESGACDEVPDTFFEGITRVLPGQIVEVSARKGGWAIRAHPPVPVRVRRVSVRTALLAALRDDRAGIVVAGAGEDDIAVPTAALLGAALAGRESHRAIRVYSNPLPGPEDSGVAELLDPIPPDALRHRALPFFTEEMDVDGYLADVGEPLPGLASYLLWATARATGAEVGVLWSALGWRGCGAHLSRLADRVAARYGVTLRFPYRELDGADDRVRAELMALAERTLPKASLRAAAFALEPPLPEVLQRLRSELATSLLYPRHGRRDLAAVDGLRQLDRLPVAELDGLWRQYLVQRWMSVVAGRRQASIPASRPAPEELNDAGQVWQRHILATEQLLDHDRVGEKIAWHIAEFASDKAARLAMRRTWYVAVAAKPVAVAQGRARAIWDIAPGRLARLLTRVLGRRPGRCPARDPWTMQVAIEEASRARMALAVLAARLGRRARAQRLAGPAWQVSPPRERACPPAHLAVVAPPRRADDTAEEIVNALRRTLPREIFATLGGCAIVSVDDEEVRRLGWAGPRDDPGLVARLCAQNPFGQGDEQTPVLVATAVPHPAAAPGREPSRRQGRQQAG
jgi:hypothetical protein